MIKINQTEYGWGNIVVTIMGRPIKGITGIDYKMKKTKEARFGAGNSAKSIQHGKREVDGTLTLMQSELIALNKAAKSKAFEDVLDTECTITVSYISSAGVITNDVISGVSFSEIPSGMKEGDLQSEHALPFIALDIEYNVTI